MIKDIENIYLDGEHRERTNLQLREMIMNLEKRIMMMETGK